MAGKYYFTFLKTTIMKSVESNKNVSTEKLLELGAVKLANLVALEKQLPLKSFGFKVGENSHKIYADKEGITYHRMTKSGMAFTEQILYKELEIFKKMTKEDKEEELRKIHSKQKYHEIIWKSKLVDQHTLPKTVEKKRERESILFNMLIDGLMEKIPATTTSADSITQNLWWSFASEVARVLVDGDKDLEETDAIDRDGKKNHTYPCCW